MGSISSTPSSTLKSCSTSKTSITSNTSITSKTSITSNTSITSKNSSTSKSCSTLKTIQGDGAIANLKPGDLIKIMRVTCSGLPGFYHFAVYLGGGYCIHLTQMEDGEHCQCLDTVTFVPGNISTECRHCGKSYTYVIVSQPVETVLDNQQFTVANNLDSEKRPLPADQIIAKAKSLLGPAYYHLFVCNCEHFANWCRYHIPVSYQTFNEWQDAETFKQVITKAYTNV